MIAIVPNPPNPTAGTVPNHCAVIPVFTAVTMSARAKTGVQSGWRTAPEYAVYPFPVRSLIKGFGFSLFLNAWANR
jgi:hypothetical protein